jgi:hypothetical protein
MLGDDASRQEMGRRGEARHDAAYSWPVVTGQLVEALDAAGLLSVVPLPRRLGT